MPALSAVIISRDAAGQIVPCLESLAFADEILVVDSGSRDDTPEIARRHGARVISEAWRGFGAQKQFAVEQARHDWVLCLDCDERVSPALAGEIARALAEPTAHAFRMRRRNRFLGRWLAHGEGYPDWSLRLFDRRHGRWSDDTIHEKVLVESPPMELEGELLHESQESLESYLDKQNRYTSLQARQLFAAGKRAGVARLLLSPLLRFLKFYLLRGGVLDGIPGLIHILIGCLNSFTKYAKLIELQRAARSGGTP